MGGGTQAPPNRPAFKSNYWEEYKGWTEEQKVASMHTGSWALTEEEPLFDAADVGGAGKDLFVYHSSVTNAAGIDWLRRHYPTTGFTPPILGEPIPPILTPLL